MSNPVIEITELALKPGVKDEQFLATIADVDAEVAAMRGFRNRRLAKSERGWIEVFEWDDLACAKEAGEKWTKVPGIRTYCSLVDYSSMKVSYHALVGGGA